MFEIAFGKLDLLVIDYIGIMKPSVNSRNERSMYLDGVAKAEQIRDMLIERNIAGVSAVQFNRSGYHNLNAGIESVSGSSGYSETSDVMISIVSDSVLRDCGMFGNVIMKNRFGPNEIAIQTRCDFEKMRWFSPTSDELANYQVKRAEAPVEENTGGGGLQKVGQTRRAKAKQSESAEEAKPTEDETPKYKDGGMDVSCI